MLAGKSVGIVGADWIFDSLQNGEWKTILMLDIPSFGLRPAKAIQISSRRIDDPVIFVLDGLEKLLAAGRHRQKPIYLYPLWRLPKAIALSPSA